MDVMLPLLEKTFFKIKRDQLPESATCFLTFKNDKTLSFSSCPDSKLQDLLQAQESDTRNNSIVQIYTKFPRQHNFDIFGIVLESHPLATSLKTIIEHKSNNRLLLLNGYSLNNKLKSMGLPP